MRYGVRYNRNKKMVEIVDIDMVDEDELLDVIEADDYFDAQKRFKVVLSTMTQNMAIVDRFNDLYNEDIRIAIENYLKSIEGTAR